MKRVLALSIIIVILSIICIYLFIPSKLKISSFVVVPANSDAVFRVVSKPAYWHSQMQTGEEVTAGPKDSSFLYNDHTFCITEMMHNAARINIDDGLFNTSSFFTVLPIAKDSSVIRWQTEVPSTFNPFEKIRRYRRAVAIKRSLSGLLDQTQDYLEKTENVYGYKFHVGSTNDTLLVAIKTQSKTYPGTNDLYSNIALLQKYVRSKGGKQTAPPMVNVTDLGTDGYQTMVALPVDTQLEVSKPYLYRKLVKGNFLITRVTGGDSTVNHALEMMRLYINDYGKTVMAIPFQRLITDRTSEPDSSKWVTEIYYPVVR